MKTADHRVAPSPCTACRHINDGALSIDSENSPDPGDVAICLRCGHLMVYGDDLMLRDPTTKEAHAMAGDKTILLAQKARDKALVHSPPEDSWVKQFCKPNTAECCRYLTMSSSGWSCEKHSNLRKHLDRRVEQGTIRAVGDNCIGRGSR